MSTGSRELADSTRRDFAARLAELFSVHTSRPGRGDVDQRVRACLVPAVRAVSEPTAESSGWLVRVADTAAEWAREGVGLDRVLLGYHEALHDGLRLATTESHGEKVIPGGCAELLLGMLRAATLATTSAYVDEFRFVARQHQTAAQTLGAALLSGHCRSTLAQQAGISIANTYQIVALSIPIPRADTRSTQASTALRRLRRVQLGIPSVLGPRALSLLTTAGGTILLPLDESAGSEPADTDAMTSQTLATLTGTAGVGLTAVVLSGRTDQIPELAARAHELLALVQSLGYPPGLYRLSDLAVEYQLSLPGPGREHLADLLEPIRATPWLIETLVTFLETGLDRVETAGRLCVHPNSITNRLHRIHQLSGLDLSHPEGVARARAALIVHGLDKRRPLVKVRPQPHR